MKVEENNGCCEDSPVGVEESKESCCPEKPVEKKKKEREKNPVAVVVAAEIRIIQTNHS